LQLEAVHAIEITKPVGYVDRKEGYVERKEGYVERKEGYVDRKEGPPIQLVSTHRHNIDSALLQTDRQTDASRQKYREKQEK
jgi:hypothetical protein